MEIVRRNKVRKSRADKTYDEPIIRIWTDGSASPNPGVGGWAALLTSGKHRKIISGAYRHTTNNRMELMAVIKALVKVKKPRIVFVFTDSKYIVDAVNKSLGNWINNGWRLASGGLVKNIDLWERFYDEIIRHDIKFFWVKGHSDNKNNNLVDNMAQHARVNKKRRRDVGYEKY